MSKYDNDDQDSDYSPQDWGSQRYDIFDVLLYSVVFFFMGFIIGGCLAWTIR